MEPAKNTSPATRGEALAAEAKLARALQALRQSDRDRFHCALAAPSRLRADLVTLYTFNAELAGIADKVSEVMLGRIRLQWWRDALQEIAAGRRHRHYLVQDLANVLARRGLSIALLNGLIDARERDLDATPPEDLAALEAYAAATAGTSCELALEVCTVAPSAAWRAAARSAGTAYGLVGISRATRYLASQRRIMLPVREMAAVGLSPDRLLELKPGPALQPVVQKVAMRALELLAAVREEGLPRRAIPALFPGRLAAAQLEQLRRHGYDPFAPGSPAPSGLNIWRLLGARLLGRI